MLAWFLVSLENTPNRHSKELSGTFYLRFFQNSKFSLEKIDGRDSPKTRRFQFGKMLALFLPLTFLAHKRYQSDPAGSHFVCRPETQ